MNNFEYIDDYLTNRLGSQERVNFEKQLETDTALRADVEFQKLTIESIKKARVAELKAMLNNVPVSSGSFSGGTAAVKIAGGVISAALIGSVTYYYLHKNPTSEIKPENKAKTESIAPPVTPEKIQPNTTTDTQVIVPAEPSSKQEQVRKNAVKENNKDKNQAPVTSAYKEPKIEVLDPSDELTTDNTEGKALIETRKNEVVPSRIEVNTDSSNKKYTFHYQFSHGKLMLYGSFDKGLYEILEINGDTHRVFLFYEGNYYLLEEKEYTTSALQAVKDTVLLKKLREYRAR